jgi:FtsH-binding integral membrane protein
MRSKNTFYFIFWLAGSLFVLGYFCMNRYISLDPKYVVCFSISAFCVSVSSFLSQIFDEYNLPKVMKIIIDLVNYLFMGIAMFSLVLFPLIIANRDLTSFSNTLIMWSLGLIFMSTVLKEVKLNLISGLKNRSNPEKTTKPPEPAKKTKETVAGQTTD